MRRQRQVEEEEEEEDDEEEEDAPALLQVVAHDAQPLALLALLKSYAPHAFLRCIFVTI